MLLSFRDTGYTMELKFVPTPRNTVHPKKLAGPQLVKKFPGPSSLDELIRKYNDFTHVELLVSHRVPPQVADRGRLTRNGGYWGNKIPRVEQNQHHCLVEKGDLERLEEEMPTENQPAQRLRWQPHH